MTQPRPLPIVGVMGSGSDEHAALARPLGQLLARLGVHLLTGGGRGVMSAVSKTFAQSPERKGLVIGILPCRGDDPARPRDGYPNPWVEVPVFTHLPASGARGTDAMSRNHINVLSSSAIIALPGGAGTASEAALAVRYGRPIIAYLGDDGTIPDLPPQVPVARSLHDVEQFLRHHLTPGERGTSAP